MKKNLHLLLCAVIFMSSTLKMNAQNIFSGEPLQVVGAFNSYATTPYNSDYRTSSYRKLSVTTGNPTDGRSQWTTNINVQATGGDVTPINMAGGGGNGFLFISGPSTNRFQNKWTFSATGQGTLNTVNDITAYNSGNDMGLNMSTAGYYSFVFNDVGYTSTNAQYYVGYTSTAPVNVNHTNVLVNANGSATVSLTTTATPATEEKIYVRYTISTNFEGTGTSNVVQATGSGTIYTATIPNQGTGANVRYYIFTSTQSLAELNAYSETKKSLALLNYDDNNGVNYGYSISVVPIKFSSFTGIKNTANTMLSWVMQSNNNINNFEVLQSSDGVNFKTIETINATIGIQKYNYTHATELNKNTFYKIIAIEKDGNKTSSSIIKITVSDNSNTLFVYPNPAQAFVNVALPKLLAGSYNLTIYNNVGQMLQSATYSNFSFNNVIKIPITNLFNKGIYLVSITNNGVVYHASFLVK